MTAVSEVHYSAYSTHSIWGAGLGSGGVVEGAHCTDTWLLIIWLVRVRLG
jgi:hypothetical protein